ncbi:hypothetical protein LPJ56_004967 [Coemansia sp. RSA 2599]|nr:hypothetical protein LPJ56_004967 [Coemansia sp. RSA 2599]
MMPYVLALANANTVGSASPRIKQVLGIPGSSGRRSAGGGLSAKQLDKLVAAISRFGSDWVAVSKEVGMSIVKCRKYAHLLVSAMSSLGVVITNPDLASLAQKRGWKGTQQK